MRAAAGTVAAAAALVAVGAAVATGLGAPPSAADVARGTEQAFATGLHPRELPPGGRPLRWTGERAVVRFRDIPRGPARLEVRLRGHRGQVSVSVDGVIVGVLGPGDHQLDAALPARSRRSCEVQIVAEAFTAGDGRRLGTQLERVALHHHGRAWPSPATVLLFVLPALAVALAALAAGLTALPSLLLAAVASVFQAGLCWPGGIVRSGYAVRLSPLLAGAALACLLFARACGRRRVGAGAWAFPALLLAVLVQGVLATAPHLVVSDAVFHANNLARVARGDWFLTSQTQHTPPIRFPYGVAFYAPLVPLWHAGLEGVALVRAAAALSGVLASAALFWLALPLGAPLAAAATVLWQLLPGTLDVYSYGNLSNVFGQAVTVFFLAWWLRGRRWWTGASLLALGGLAHFSTLVALSVLAVCLVVAERDRARAAAVAAGLLAAALYYARFVPLVLEQLPRLGGAGGMAGGLGEGLARALFAFPRQWGLPALLLAVAGTAAAWPERERRALLACAVSGALLLAAALLSPLEVRYLYALGPALALGGGAGVVRFRPWSLVLLGLQAVLAGRNALEALLARYRP
jgi:hypothetical protein